MQDTRGSKSTRWQARRIKAARSTAKALEGTTGLEACVLFGSLARGEASRGSDIDIALIGTAQGCEEACRQWPMELEGTPVEIVELAAETGYGGVGIRGALGREIVETGTALSGAARVRELAHGEARAMTPEEIWGAHEQQLEETVDSLEKWEKALSRPTSTAVLRGAARQSAFAGELLLKGAVRNRGLPIATVHDTSAIAGHAVGALERGEVGVAVLPGTPEEVAARIEEIRKAVNCNVHKDHLNGYWDVRDEDKVPNTPKERERVERRLVGVLRYTREEHSRLKARNTMGGMTEGVKEAVEALAKVAGRLMERAEITPELRTQCHSWKAVEGGPPAIAPRESTMPEVQGPPRPRGAARRRGRERG